MSLCEDCDWNKESLGFTSSGQKIHCEAMNKSCLKDEIKGCLLYSHDQRNGSENYIQYKDRVDNKKLIIKADKRAIWALIISLLALLIAASKFIFDVINK